MANPAFSPSNNQIDLSQDAVYWEFDPATRQYLHIDEKIEQLTGFTSWQWFEPNFQDKHIHDDDKKWVNTLPKNQTEFIKEYRFITADNKIIWIQNAITLSIDQNGLSKFHGYMSDITDQKSVENAVFTLASSSPDASTDDFFYECVENISNVYSAKYAFIGLLNANKQQIETLAVWANGQIIDNFSYDLLHTPCADVICSDKEIIPTGVTKLYPKDELLVQMGVDSYFGTPLSPNKGNTTGIMVVLDDKPMQLTSWTSPVLSMFASRIAVELEKRKQTLKLQQMMQQAQAANLIKTEFLANISHELRTPMHAILAFSDLGLRKIVDAPRDRLSKYFSNINNSAGNLLALINNLLDLTKLESDKAQLDKKSYSLCQLVDTCLAEQSAAIKQKNITFISNSPGTSCSAEFDACKIRQVVTNLISNAIKFSPEAKKIYIFINIITTSNDAKTKSNADYVNFTIEDEGPGIPEDELESIFDRFIQSSKTKTGAGGTGLGLSICDEIIKLHDGKIFAVNRKSGGAKFEFIIPVCTNPTGEPAIQLE